uniref:LRR containing protein n=1 Tax=Panagrolaimus davidi TaxID=227884 RepID=A0A914Q1B7_9BILA
MSVLNREILEDIFVELLEGCNTSPNNLQKFMVSGRQSFIIALKYLERVIYGAEFFENDIRITTAKRVNKIYRICYDFCFIKSFLYAIGDGVKKLIITRYFPEEPMASIVMERLIGTRLKEVHYSNDISPTFYQRLNHFDKSAKFSFCSINDLKVISTLPLSCKSLEIFACNFERLFHGNVNVKPFSQIEEFCIRGDFDIGKFAENDIKQMSNFISTKFPNLKHVKIEFENVYSRHVSNSKYKTIAFQPTLFSGIPTNVHGSIKFFVQENRLSGYVNNTCNCLTDLALNINPNLTFKYDFVRY